MCCIALYWSNVCRWIRHANVQILYWNSLFLFAELHSSNWRRLFLSNPMKLFDCYYVCVKMRVFCYWMPLHSSVNWVCVWSQRGKHMFARSSPLLWSKCYWHRKFLLITRYSTLLTHYVSLLVYLTFMVKSLR